MRESTDWGMRISSGKICLLAERKTVRLRGEWAARLIQQNLSEHRLLIGWRQKRSLFYIPRCYLCGGAVSNCCWSHPVNRVLCHLDWFFATLFCVSHRRRVCSVCVIRWSCRTSWQRWQGSGRDVFEGTKKGGKRNASAVDFLAENQIWHFSKIRLLIQT